MSIMMMFSFAAAAKCGGEVGECQPTVCCMENNVSVLGACNLAEDDAETCRGCTEAGLLEVGDDTCADFATLNEGVGALSAALINSTTHTDETLMTKLTMKQIVAAAMKSIMSPDDHLAVAMFQQGTLECNAPADNMDNSTTPAPDTDSAGETAKAGATCKIEDDGKCCGVPTLPSCLEANMCNCGYFCDENTHKDIISAYTSVTNKSAIIVLQQKNLTMVKAPEDETRMALLEGLNGDMQEKLREANEFFSSAATLGGCALVLAMVMNF